MVDSPTIDLFEHLPHAFNVVVVEEPCLRVPFILFKGYSKRVRDVDCLAVVLPEQHADDPLRRALRHGPRMVVGDREEDERVYD